MPNIKLSPAELALANNSEILMMKNRIIHAVYELFGNLSAFYVTTIEKYPFPAKITAHASPKISRGENYLGLPWVMLDYPRYFTQHDIFSIRTMFWWGKHFSQFLLLKGEFLPAINDNVIAQLLQHKEWFLCVSKDPFQHHFEEKNMISLKALTGKEIANYIADNGLLKLGIKIPITALHNLEVPIQHYFQSMLQIASLP